MFQAPKFDPYLHVVIGIGGNTHQTYDADVWQRVEGGRLEQVDGFFRRKPELGFFLSNKNLEQTLDHAVVLTGLPVNFFQQFQAIDRLDEGHKRGNVFDLIGLQMANLMPLHVGGELGLLVNHLLHTIFAKMTATGLVGFLQQGHRFGFGNGHEPGTTGELGLNLGDRFRNGHLPFGKNVGTVV